MINGLMWYEWVGIGFLMVIIIGFRLMLEGHIPKWPFKKDDD